MEREGVAADFAVSLPRDLPVADMDLCALLGNALDNAIEGSRGAGERRITIRCKADKGLFMLRVENTLGGAVQPDLATTKTDKAAHGFGIPGKSQSATAAPWTPGSGTTGSSWWCACPWQGRPKHCKSPCADGRRRHRRELDFPYLRCICTEKQGGRPMDGLRSQSGLKASSKVRSVPRRGQ